MADTTRLVMGMDGGGSRTTAWLADAQGNVLSKAQASASNYQSVGETAAKAALLQAIQEAFLQANLLPQKLAALCLGLAGFGRDEDRRLADDWAQQAGLAEQVIVVNDADLLLWAATPDGWGLGLVCGTGSIAIGKTPEGRTARVGGWGYLIGDEGSGYALGLAALRAAAQASDGRIPATLLQMDVLDALGLEKAEQLVAYLYQHERSREEIARLAGVVLKAAGRGDERARQIARGAAAELARAALAVGAGLGWPLHQAAPAWASIPCALGGGVFVHHPQFALQVVRRVRQTGLRLGPVQTAPQPVAGAIRLALRLLNEGQEVRST